MSSKGKSRLSFLFAVIFLFGQVISSGQQKVNDFTKRVGIFDGKMSSLSGRSSKFNRISPSSARRISVSEWPAHFSPFGGKRFPMGEITILGKERVSSSKIEIKTPLNDQVAPENFQRVTNRNLSKQEPAANAIEFRDAYYARLNDRVEEWMDKVNNISLRDINRYQFRRDRPKEPGFPVQRAGASGKKDARVQSTLKGTGLPSTKPISLPFGNETYWMGPKRIQTNASSAQKSSGSQSKENLPSMRSNVHNRNYKAGPKPILGPKTIRVDVGGAE